MFLTYLRKISWTILLDMFFFIYLNKCGNVYNELFYSSALTYQLHNALSFDRQSDIHRNNPGKIYLIYKYIYYNFCSLNSLCGPIHGQIIFAILYIATLIYHAAYSCLAYKTFPIYGQRPVVQNMIDFAKIYCIYKLKPLIFFS